MTENLNKYQYNNSLSYDNTLPSLFSKKKKMLSPSCIAVTWETKYRNQPKPQSNLNKEQHLCPPSIVKYVWNPSFPTRY